MTDENDDLMSDTELLDALQQYMNPDGPVVAVWEFGMGAACLFPPDNDEERKAAFPSVRKALQRMIENGKPTIVEHLAKKVHNENIEIDQVPERHRESVEKKLEEFNTE